MPSKSPAQARLMAGISHGWIPTHLSGGAPPPPHSVAVDFNQADTGTPLLHVAVSHQAVPVQKMQAAILRGGKAGHPFGARGKKTGP